MLIFICVFLYRSQWALVVYIWLPLMIFCHMVWYGFSFWCVKNSVLYSLVFVGCVYLLELVFPVSFICIALSLLLFCIYILDLDFYCMCWQRRDSSALHLLSKVHAPLRPLPTRCNLLLCRAILTPGGGSWTPLTKSASVFLKRSALSFPLLLWDFFYKLLTLLCIDEYEFHDITLYHCEIIFKFVKICPFDLLFCTIYTAKKWNHAYIMGVFGMYYTFHKHKCIV